ncbi:SigE family RNA polymerase sigma factor [Actinospica durhamensis]|uniref:SigE family RNA polymerase sigma factor n=1 Tax=Actinospica durhamensis TaxID=1508375 RepID=A0A941ESR1_9ACTN|nr:SigE family RNA polymerase sigma factor [Actinospica durhamensis]MBR7836498.1 SigE family RNA polymerase sigma factor [Actinospica durhamensis]
MTDQDAATAFTEYFAARQTWLRGVAYMLCQDWHRADDLLQTTAMRLYARWPRADRIENLDAYARKILVNTFLAEQRSPWWKRVIPHWENTDGAVEAPDPSDALDLRAALAALPPRQRATVILRYYDELSVLEVAEILGCAPGTVKSQTARALTALRRTLTDEDAAADLAPATFTLINSARTAVHVEGSKP